MHIESWLALVERPLMQMDSRTASLQRKRERQGKQVERRPPRIASTWSRLAAVSYTHLIRLERRRIYGGASRNRISGAAFAHSDPDPNSQDGDRSGSAYDRPKPPLLIDGLGLFCSRRSSSFWWCRRSHRWRSGSPLPALQRIQRGLRLAAVILNPLERFWITP